MDVRNLGKFALSLIAAGLFATAACSHGDADLTRSSRLALGSADASPEDRPDASPAGTADAAEGDDDPDAGDGDDGPDAGEGGGDDDDDGGGGCSASTHPSTDPSTAGLIFFLPALAFLARRRRA